MRRRVSWARGVVRIFVAVVIADNPILFLPAVNMAPWEPGAVHQLFCQGWRLSTIVKWCGDFWILLQMPGGPEAAATDAPTAPPIHATPPARTSTRTRHDCSNRLRPGR